MTSSVISICFWLSALLRVVGDHRQQRPEGQRVHQHAHEGAVLPSSPSTIVATASAALVVVGGVHVEEDGAPALRLRCRPDRLGVGQRRAQVQVHAEDVEAVARQLAGGGAAEAAGRAEDTAQPLDSVIARLLRL